GVVELLLECIEAAKGLLEGVGNLALGLATAFALHNAPEHAVVDVTAAVIADCGPDVFGNTVYSSQKVVGGLVLQLRVFLQGGIQVLNIGRMMSIVMQVHGLRVYVGFEC